jgi:acetoacetyl-CoA synthetase
MTNPLWKPSQSRIQSTSMHRFMQAIGETVKDDVSTYSALHAWSVSKNEDFWKSVWDFFSVIGSQGQTIVQDKHLMPGAKWFPEAQLNFAQNLLKHCSSRAHETAITQYSEDGFVEKVSYEELYRNVALVADRLKQAGLEPGDRVAAVSTNTKHAVIAMLATTSLGAVWSSCSPDFGEQGILDRFEQIKPKVLIACTDYQYAGKAICCRDKIDKVSNALESLVLRIDFKPLLCTDANKQSDAPQTYAERDLKHNALHFESVYWDDIVNADRIPEPLEFKAMGFNDPLYILYSSGTTGKPKCIVHGIGGTLLQHLKELGLHTNVAEGSRVFYFTTCGWMMWNWLVSTLALGGSLHLFDGSPFHASKSILFDMAETENVDVFGASAKYYAACEKYGLKPIITHKLDSLQSLLSTGSPLSHESFEYLYRNVKADVCVSSISGGTDIVSCFALGNPVLPVYTGELQCAGLGMELAFADDDGQAMQHGKGELVCLSSFPSMPIYFWNDQDGTRYHDAYFSRFKNTWAHGDFGEYCQHSLEDGSIQSGVVIHGRSDAVLNPNGVRIGTAEIYRQVERVEDVFESIVVGQEWENDIRVVLFVRLQPGAVLNDALREQIKITIRENTSPRHVPAKIIEVLDIPRTRSGKIVELAVRNVIHGLPVKNTEALANPEALTLFENLSELSQ